MADQPSFSSDKYKGNDNYGKPRIDYCNRVAAMSDEQLLKETEQKIWLSAYAANNPRSDYHWHVDACYDVCCTREGKLYDKAYKQACGSM